jgi:hypothetical protein
LDVALAVVLEADLFAIHEQPPAQTQSHNPHLTVLPRSIAEATLELHWFGQTRLAAAAEPLLTCQSTRTNQPAAEHQAQGQEDWMEGEEGDWHGWPMRSSST